jgi:hypothetical protein
MMIAAPLLLAPPPPSTHRTPPPPPPLPLPPPLPYWATNLPSRNHSIGENDTGHRVGEGYELGVTKIRYSIN